MSAETATTTATEHELATLREVVELLAPLDRLAGSPGEREAAHMLADRLRASGAPARVETASFLRDWAASFAGATAVAALIGLFASRRWRLRAGLASTALGALIGEDTSNGPRLLRRALRRRAETQNVIAEIGDPDAPRTLIVLAHHDAARGGALFDQGMQQLAHKLVPTYVESVKTSPPLWWPAIFAPVFVGLGLLTGSRRIKRTGVVLSVGATAALLDVSRRSVVPGANDNLSAVAALVALADRLRAHPIDGLRVVLLSAGAEEELQGGISSYIDRYRGQLPAGSTWCVTLDTIGSPQLVMLEGEGTIVMEDYTDPAFRDLAADVAVRRGVDLERGLRSRFSSDSVIVSRAGISTLTLVSLTKWRAPANYHMYSDTPENLHYDTVAAAVELTDALAREIAAG